MRLPGPIPPNSQCRTPKRVIALFVEPKVTRTDSVPRHQRDKEETMMFYDYEEPTCVCGHEWGSHDQLLACTIEDCPCFYYEANE
jgi:hypothetical protein